MNNSFAPDASEVGDLGCVQRRQPSVRQEQVLDAVVHYRMGQGRMPLYEELALVLGCHSAVAHALAGELVGLGYLTRVGGERRHRPPRALRFTPQAWERYELLLRVGGAGLWEEDRVVFEEFVAAKPI